MSIKGDSGLIQKYREIEDACSMKIMIRHDQIIEVVVADLMSKYKACLKRNDGYADSFEKVLSFYLTPHEMAEMEDLFET